MSASRHRKASTAYQSIFPSSSKRHGIYHKVQKKQCQFSKSRGADVCKDYKQTGFCGFGDNCKFVHIREDYKQGWQRDREWEDVTRGKKKVSGTVVASIDGKDAKEEEDGDEETFLQSIPFTCIICKASCKEPIVTRCGHYFCQPCALKRYRKDPTCAACGADTNGVFNSAKRLEKLLEKKSERAAKRRLAGTEDGDEVSDENEGQR
ncbi:Pre-mRNA-splicing factor cwc24 [Fusarium kuroshium]|uniref:Pre-mRNA-splicing factor CWC24 n=1 Tax=Fusarium kuroshium TaxID=2010991 RepID=A0A3M2SBG4_9HYPO|nr:Pre-mRNA-splicing factor cwc24 [Fusarium kuroshium]